MSGPARRRGVVAAAMALALGVSACGSGNEPTSAASATDRLEVVSWWTSGSESRALDTLFDAYRRTNPGVDAVNAAVPGGAGSNAIVALAQRLQKNDPPDVWQTFAGESVRGYASRGVVRDVSAVFSRAGLAASMQPVIRASVIRNGKPYGVPTGAHRSNVLWFNPQVLRTAGVTPPGSGYTMAAFLDDLRTVKASGATPLCLGARDPFTTMELFENLLLSSIGTTGWRAMTKDTLDWRSAKVRSALTQFSTVLSFADPRASEQTWDQATRRLKTGGCAFESMNDSAFGELLADGGREGTDFAGVPFPGTGGSFLAVVDVFVAATRAQNAKNALAFLSDIDQPSTQLVFSRAKGSVPVVRGVDVTSLPAYQQAASKSLWSDPVLLSVTHGEAMSPRFQEGFYTAVSSYVRTRDPGAFADDLSNAVNQEQIPQR